MNQSARRPPALPLAALLTTVAVSCAANPIDGQVRCVDSRGVVVDSRQCDTGGGGYSYYIFDQGGYRGPGAYGAGSYPVGSTVPPDAEGSTRVAANDPAARESAGLPRSGAVDVRAPVRVPAATLGRGGTSFGGFGGGESAGGDSAGG